MNRFWHLPAALLLLAGCTVGPDYQTPADPAATRYDLANLPAEEQVVTTGPTLDDHIPPPADWWTLLRCPALDATEKLARDANNTLAAAKATVRQAEQVVLQARAAYWPQADLNGGVQRNGSGNFTPAGGSTSSNFFSIGPAFSYSVDLFGGTARTIEQSEAQADYQRAQLAAADLTVTGAVASEAIALAGARLQIGSAEEILTADRQNLAMVEQQFASGKAARSDILTAQSQLLGDQTQIAQFRQQLSVARHALAVLASKVPADWAPPDFALADFALPTALPTILPSALAHQRPDIVAAERQLHSASAAIGVAVAQYYPSILLSAALTQQAITPNQLFNSVNTLWSVGSSLSTPLFHGGALDAQKQAAILAFQSQRATYEQTVIVAFGQVADSLRALDHDAEQRHDAQAALDISAASLALQQASYRVGKTSLLQLLAAQRLFAQANQGLATAQTQQLQDVVQFFQALGGGIPQQSETR